MLMSRIVDMSSSKGTLLDSGLKFLEEPKTEADLRKKYEIQEEDIDKSIDKYQTEEALRKQQRSWESTIAQTTDPQGKCGRALAIGKLALAKMQARLQTSSTKWKAQVR